jgi:hypothetical protein
MIKTHVKTGLKYLCQTSRKNYTEYLGSGTAWKKHLTEHGEQITTILLLETTDKYLLSERGKYYSSLWNIVASDEWANLTEESGLGGNTTSNRMWITDGNNERYVHCSDEIPTGWKKGRGLACSFKNSVAQKEFASRVDRSQSSSLMKTAWAHGKFNNRPSLSGKPGLKHSLKTKLRLSEVAKNRVLRPCPLCGELFKNPEVHLAKSALHNG